MNPFNRRQFLGLAAGTVLSSGFITPTSVQATQAGTPQTVSLPISPRLQWDELNGYCGECMVQQAALYYGTYASQWACRAIINRNQSNQLLVGVNDQQVLTALRLTSQNFDDQQQPTPQYKAYFGWIKQQLASQHPVIITTYVQGLYDTDYDHIMLATGFTSTESITYHPTDQLIFNDGYSQTPLTRLAATLFDTRAMNRNGALFEYCLPETVDYGCAVTGIHDTSRAALPVQLHLNHWSEPDLVASQHPTTFDATATVNGLTPGKTYVLYRYNNYNNVPTHNYTKSRYSSLTRFVPTQTTAACAVKIPSNGVAIFRCLPAGL